jgi:hypothetical protein
MRLHLPVVWHKWGDEKSYYLGDVGNLSLQYVQNWGRHDEDDAITLICTDYATDTKYSADITDIDEDLDQLFILNCLIDNYGQSVREVFSSRLRLDKSGKARLSRLTFFRSKVHDYLDAY